MKKELLAAVKFIILMSILTGFIYPLVMTGMAQLFFPWKANGSLVERDGKIVGSELIGQKFDSAIYFCPRPSASDYRTIPSGASNLGPVSQILIQNMHNRRMDFVKKNGLTDTLAVPPDMIFASGSGLDPHISPASALYQVKRISQARHFDSDRTGQLIRLVNDMTEMPQFMLLGEKRINVFKLNLRLDRFDNEQNKLK